MVRNLCMLMTVLSSIHMAYGDYTCICNYNVEKSVYPQKSEQVSPVGYMYEFDCKAQYGTIDGDWIPIAFEHQLGYVHRDSQLLAQVCAGSPPKDDIVATTLAPSTTTTPLSTTSKTAMPNTTTNQVTVTTTQLPTSASTALTNTTTAETTPLTTPASSARPSSVSPTLSTKTVTTMRGSTSTVSSPTPRTSLQTSPTSISSAVTSATTSSSLGSSTSSTASSTSASPTTIQPTTSTTAHLTATTTSKPFTPATSKPSTPTTSKPTTQTTSKPTTQTTVKPTTLSTASTSTTTTTMKPVPTTQSTRVSCKALLKDIIGRDNGTLFAYGDECFELIGVRTTWVNAELECRRKGGHLVDIANSNEQRIVYQVVNTYYHDSVWIGLHDRHHEEQFEWTTGKPVEYTNWIPWRKSATDHWTEDCVAMGMGQYSGRWGDRPCDELRGFVCQFGLGIGGSVLIG